MAFTTTPADNEFIANLPGDIRAVTDVVTAHKEGASAVHPASAISFTATGTIAATNAQGAIAEVASDVSGHTGASSGAHAASAISFTATGTVSATNAQGAIAEVASDVSGHTGASAGAHAASAISFAPTSDMSSTSVQAAIVEAEGRKIPGIESHIASGRKMSLNATALTLDISSGVDYIDKTVRREANSIALPARSTNLVYDTAAGGTGVVAAAFPAADAGTVCRWIIDGSSTIASTVGSNNLTKGGTVAQVDGWIGYGGKGDGSTGYYVSANSTGFPTGAGVREVDVVFTYNGQTGARQEIAAYGSGNGYFTIETAASLDNLVVAMNGNAFDTSYVLTMGKTYAISFQYDGTTASVYVNGEKVYSLTGALATTATTLSVGYLPGYGFYCKHTFHYVELRNALRTPAQIAEISNKMLLPCRYTAPVASYPTVHTGDLTTYHQWKFDENSGTIYDSNTSSAIDFTSTSTTVVPSSIGLGNARYFNGTSDYGQSSNNITFASEFTVISVFVLGDYSTTRPIFGNRNIVGNLFYISNGGKLAIASNSNGVNSTGSNVPLGVPCFGAVVCSGGLASFYNNSSSPEAVGLSYAVDTSTNNIAYVGYGYPGANAYFKGIIDYVIYIPRALSQAEIAQYYNALMKTANRDISSFIPANSVSLGLVRTNSSGILELNDTDYKYGRREGASGGNRRVDLGWKYFSGDVTVGPWNNIPFCNDSRVIITPFYKRELFLPEVPCVMGSGASSAVGVAVVKGRNGNISVDVSGYGAAYYDNSAQTSGYIGCYAEVIE